MVAKIDGQFAESSSVRLGHSREAQMLRLVDGNALLGETTKRLKKLDETSTAPAEIREDLVAGRTLDIVGQSDLSSPCVSPGFEFLGLFCSLQRLQFWARALSFLRRRGLPAQ